MVDHTIDNSAPKTAALFTRAQEVLAKHCGLADDDSPYKLAIKIALTRFSEAWRTAAPGQNAEVDEAEATHSALAEEPITASLIGFFATAFYTVGLLEVLGGAERTLPTMAWGFQSKSSEAVSGGDFGLAYERTDEKLAIAFFQAKRSTTGQMMNIHRFTAPKDNECAKYDEELRSYLRLGVLPDSKTATTGAGHQLVKLAQTKARGKQFTQQTDMDWVHYVAWNDSGKSAYTVSVDCVRDSLKPFWRKGTVTSKKDEQTFTKSMTVDLSNLPKDSNSHCSFLDLLLRAEESVDNDVLRPGWLVVTVEQAIQLIGPLIALGQPWNFFGSKSGSAGQVAAKFQSEAEHNFDVTSSTSDHEAPDRSPSNTYSPLTPHF